jgi:hypothetical protein
MGKWQPMATREFRPDEWFPRDYATARSNFLNAVESAGGAITSYVHTAPGPSGEELATDVALLGSPHAKNVLVLVSGTHGVEGLAGSGLQVAQVQSGLRPPPGADLAILLVHTLNPFGAAFKRRVNEDSIDLNRNFATFPANLPNAAYDELHDLLTMGPSGLAHVRRGIAFASFVAKRGRRALQEAVTKGQYNHPTGLFFGGAEPSWSRKTWDQILTSLAGKHKVVVVDYHTGLGPRGSGQLVSQWGSAFGAGVSGPRSAVLADCFGRDVVVDPEENSVSAGLSGDLLSYTVNSGNHLLAVALEFGTYPALRVLSALIDENWAHHSEDPAIEKYRKRLVEVFSPDDVSWKRAVYERASAVSQAAIRGLSH